MVTRLIVISISLVTYRIIEVRARQALRFAFSLKPRRPDKIVYEPEVTATGFGRGPDRQIPRSH
jgi:hypothetical protein